MGEVVVRRAGAADMQAVGGLRWAWIVEEQDGRSGLSRARFLEEFAAWADAHAATHECFLAEDEGTVIGMAWAARTARVPSPRAMERRTGDLQSVYVSPPFRGRGVGGRLIDAAVDALAAQGAERVVVHSSPGAVGAYARAGLLPSDLLRQRDLRVLG